MGARKDKVPAERDPAEIIGTRLTDQGYVTKVTARGLLATIADLRKNGDPAQKRAGRRMLRYYKNRKHYEFFYITNDPEKPMCKADLWESAPALAESESPTE